MKHGERSGDERCSCYERGAPEVTEVRGSARHLKSNQPTICGDDEGGFVHRAENVWLTQVAHCETRHLRARMRSQRATIRPESEPTKGWSVMGAVDGNRSGASERRRFTDFFWAIFARLRSALNRYSIDRAETATPSSEAEVATRPRCLETQPTRNGMFCSQVEESFSAASPSASATANSELAEAGGIPIYNFQHGMSSRRTLRFGPYLIRLESNDHVDTSIFSSSGGRQLSSTLDENGALAHVSSPLTPRPGIWTETAIVEDHPALQASSALFPLLPFLSGRDDLALILWFLTGREVAVGSGPSQRFMLGGTADRLVSPNYFYAPTIDWSKLSLLASNGASDALYAVCLALASPDALLKISVASGALDALVSRWYKENRENPASDEVRARFKMALGAYEARLLEVGESAELVADVLARVPNLLNDASALAKLRAFLAGHQMLESDADETVFGRVKLLNTYRNAVAHQAKILVNSKAPVDTQLRIAGVVSLLLTMICRVYIAKHLLGVVGDDYGVEKDEACIRDFFKTGIFRGQDVFNESYDDFIRRVDDAWTLRGEFPL